MNDINNDNSVSFVEKDDNYVLTSTVNYPNNRDLVKQNIYLDKKMNFKKVEVLNSAGIAEIKMTFNEIDTNPTFKDDYFDLQKNLKAAVIDETVNQVISIDDIVFPMYVPDNTTLSSQDVIAKNDGERVILTFGGEKPFVLIEETVSIEEELEIIPTLGEPIFLLDTVGALSSNSVSWISNGMEYYIASEVLSNEELVNVAKSISTIPVMK